MLRKAFNVKQLNTKHSKRITKVKCYNNISELYKTTGAHLVVKSLEVLNVNRIYSIPGGASVLIDIELSKSKKIKNTLMRHEQAAIFAAEGYAKSSGKVGVVETTSGPGCLNLVTGLGDAMMNFVPLVALTGQVNSKLLGSDAFQETPIVEVTRSITKHNYLVLNAFDIPRILKEAFLIAGKLGRSGPVLIDIPKDIQNQEIFVSADFISKCKISESVIFKFISYEKIFQKSFENEIDSFINHLLYNSKKPILYCGGGCQNASNELQYFATKMNIPVALTLQGLGVFPNENPLYLGMLGMHGSVYCNDAIDKSDFLIALGVRFDDRVTGKVESFAHHAKIAHIDIDFSEIGKNKYVDIPICSDVKRFLQKVNEKLLYYDFLNNFEIWNRNIQVNKKNFPIQIPDYSDMISAQKAIKELSYEIQKRRKDAIISCGVGQDQMWTAQHFPFHKARHALWSGGCAAMGVSIPYSIGVCSYLEEKRCNGDLYVISIDGDGSFQMNIQELATIAVEQMDVKIFLINNQTLGNVKFWVDMFYKDIKRNKILKDTIDHQ
ncbi:hypothetical protein DUNSADRAFT_5719 [Dunaliella salina]|uniref:Acetolactate synthase n=1 Tax=Dunaliella salina TaxID=3046 RepID=A0ABQ7FU52_DUNSA|nr:hypothetical protein DUNSADRAFT_5719 [Dunaliella salina]|eukprot:KAF5825947.1 hypothetical protein DUNSADRAFT_5719 [Dunaliella salina]